MGGGFSLERQARNVAFTAGATRNVPELFDPWADSVAPPLVKSSKAEGTR
jgi:hypothetical protein